MPKMCKAWILENAGSYDYGDSGNMAGLEQRVFEAIREMGSPPAQLTKPIFLDIVRWKAPRALGRARKNDPGLVVEVMRASLSAEREEIRVGALTLLDGVRYRMASAILYFCFPKRYPIMDYRAWGSMRAFGEIEGPLGDDFKCWKKYTDVCRKLSERHQVSLRTLDKALWVYNGGNR